MKFDQYIIELDNYVSEFYDKDEIPNILKEAVRYSFFAGGKRLRPIFMYSLVKAAGEDFMKCTPAAAALEMIHTFSLIHDDLPAMDDDDFRRGRLTNHKVYGEAMAILAGDTLLNDAYLAMTDLKLDPELKLNLIAYLSKCAGSTGMIKGQVLDLENTDKEITISELEEININKTSRLLQFAFYAGALIGTKDKEKAMIASEAAQLLGVAFQIKDDILDIYGSEEELGKSVGSDKKNKRSTYPSLLGKEDSEMLLKNYINTAKDMLRKINLLSEEIEYLCDFINLRTK
jgi:geranylgeranyl diphosphate synthase type II